MAAMSGLAGRIAATRKARGINRSEFARLVGVTPPAVWNWEENGMIPRTEALSNIARVLGVSENYLKSGAEDGGSTVAPKTVASIVENARKEIAAATGFPASRIKIDVAFVTN